MIEVKRNFKIREPKNGDKVLITDFSGFPQGSGNLVARLSKLPHCTVEDVDIVPIGVNGEYEWRFGIYIYEAPGYVIAPNEYKFV